MTFADRIRNMSDLPARFNTMLEQALLVLRDEHQDELCKVACIVSSAAWRFWHSWRQPEDNRQEHEWVVFANLMKIAEAENLTVSEKRTATAFAFTHDTYFIPRIMEQRVRDAKTPELKAQLEKEKVEQRIEHMQGGAKNAEFLLTQLRDPDTPADLLFEPDEIARCVRIVSEHDLWKLRNPSPPPSSDRLAVACLEADALWPLHPFGVLADLERPNENGETKDFADPAAWHQQLLESNRPLIEFRQKWKDIPPGDFIDGESIFRTREGHRLYSEWRQRWNLIDTE
jgi:hypothetical protein